MVQHWVFSFPLCIDAFAFTLTSSLVRPVTLLLTPSLARLLACALAHPLDHSFTHSLTHPPTHPLTRPVTHPLVHPPPHSSSPLLLTRSPHPPFTHQPPLTLGPAHRPAHPATHPVIQFDSLCLLSNPHSTLAQILKCKPCRALDGDVVAVELLPESQWKGERSSLPQADAESINGAEEEDEDDPEGGHIAQVRP